MLKVRDKVRDGHKECSRGIGAAGKQPEGLSNKAPDL